jgi:hypothetical protein
MPRRRKSAPGAPSSSPRDRARADMPHDQAAGDFEELRGLLGDPRLAEAGQGSTPVAVTGPMLGSSALARAWYRFVETTHGRLVRGRAYLRAGAVLDLRVHRGIITAEVQGTRRYHVKIAVALPGGPPLLELRARLGAAVTLRGAALHDVILGAAQALLPAPRHIVPFCQCLDAAPFCKHVCAALYGLGVRLDGEPELLLVLRGLAPEPSATERSALTPLAAEKVLEGDLGALFGIELLASPAASAPATAPTQPQQSPPSPPASPSSPASPARPLRPRRRIRRAPRRRRPSTRQPSRRCPPGSSSSSTPRPSSSPTRSRWRVRPRSGASTCASSGSRPPRSTPGCARGSCGAPAGTACTSGPRRLAAGSPPTSGCDDRPAGPRLVCSRSPMTSTDLDIEEERPPRRIVIGEGRIGTVFSRAAGCALVTRHRGWYVLDEPAGDPIAVCVRNDDLGAVLTAVPKHRWADLVFVQNGMIDPWLEDHGLEGNTRGLLFFAVATRGGAAEPGGISRFTGAHANAMALWLESLGLRAEVIGRRAFSAVMLEKLIWNTAFGLLCERHGVGVGVILEQQGAELAALSRELNAVGRAALGHRPRRRRAARRPARLRRQHPGHRAGVKEWPWRGGWFDESARVYRVEVPTFDALVAAVPSLSR